MRNWNAFLGMYFYFSVCKKRYNLLNFEGFLSYFYRSWNNCQKYVDFFESCWRTSKCSYQRTTLGTIGEEQKKFRNLFKDLFFILCLNFRLLLSKWNSSWPMIAVWQIFWDWIFITLKMKYIMLWIKLLKKWPWRKCSGIWSRLGPAWNLFMNCMPGLVVIF